MVGNDVVDIHDVDADITTYSQRFDARVFRDAERAAIERDQLGKTTRWQLWAAKEACFKAAKQEDPSTIFSPRAFEVWFEKRWAETWMPVRHTSGQFLVVLEPGSDRVHALAARAPSDFTYVLRAVVPRGTAEGGSEGDPSTQVRQLAREAFAKQLDVDPNRVDITKSGRIPKLRLDGEPLDMSLSLSHHGDWLAYAVETRGVAA